MRANIRNFRVANLIVFHLVCWMSQVVYVQNCVERIKSILKFSNSFWANGEVSMRRAVVFRFWWPFQEQATQACCCERSAQERGFSAATQSVCIQYLMIQILHRQKICIIQNFLSSKTNRTYMQKHGKCIQADLFIAEGINLRPCSHSSLLSEYSAAGYCDVGKGQPHCREKIKIFLCFHCTMER